MIFGSYKEKKKHYASLNEEQKIEALNEMVSTSEHIVFLGGAGVSTESGIPDFRSKDGLYKKRDKKFAAYKGLIGVDLSAKMLEIAKAKKIYAELICDVLRTQLSGGS